jgi:VWFA-related protein
MLFRNAIILIAFLLLITSVGFAQDDPPITVDTSIVRLNVGVADSRGHPITTLNQSNFTVFEDGVKQQISRFEPSTAPFSVVLMLDMSGSTLGFRQIIKLSANRFIDALGPDDRVAVVEFYDQINLRNDFTTKRETIAFSIAASEGRGKTQFYKALEFALDKLAREKSRRKAIIVLTDGVDTAARDRDRELLQATAESKIPTAIKAESSEILNHVLNRADQQGVTIYPLALPTGDPAKLADPSPLQVAMYRAARTRLQILAERSGGAMNAIDRLEQMGVLYAKVAADLRTLYTIEYQPLNDKRDGNWRSIKIETADPNLISRTRTGYFAK